MKTHKATTTATKTATTKNNAHASNGRRRRLKMNTTTTEIDGKRLRRASGWSAAAVALSVLAAACAPEMDPVSLVERTRVIGARVEVEGAPERSSPRPGETANVSWLMTSPTDMPPLGWAFVLCPGASAGDDLGGVGEPLAIFQGRDHPTMKVVVPAREALGNASELVLFGRVCTASEPKLDATGRPVCTDSGDGTTAAVSITLERDDWTNRNPVLDAEAFRFADLPWRATAAGATCADLPQVKAATEDHVIRIETSAADRESYVIMQGDPLRPTNKREWLQISQYITAGEYERSFSTIETDALGDRPSVEVKWEAPAADKVPAEGLVVRFTFVARDMRGGVDWTTRAVCVTP
jgi:hypothetical protein